MAATRWLLLALGVLLTACSGGGASASDCEPIPGAREGLCPIPVDERDDAPVDRLETVAGDEEVSVEDLDGRIVVLNFWASWCGPCRAEQPDLNEVHAAVPADDVAFLGVNIEDSRPNAQAHIDEFEIPYPSLFDPANDYASRFTGVGPRTIPSTILIDAEGRVAARIMGVTDVPELLGLTERLADEV
ncbi:MAG: TlpA family protein disulfide reductase [Nitriliruptoraceae bacterium]